MLVQHTDRCWSTVRVRLLGSVSKHHSTVRARSKAKCEQEARQWSTTQCERRGATQGDFAEKPKECHDGQVSEEPFFCTRSLVRSQLSSRDSRVVSWGGLPVCGVGAACVACVAWSGGSFSEDDKDDSVDYKGDSVGSAVVSNLRLECRSLERRLGPFKKPD